MTKSTKSEINRYQEAMKSMNMIRDIEEILSFDISYYYQTILIKHTIDEWREGK